MTALLNQSTNIERELLHLAAGGSEVAFTKIFNLYKNKLYSFVLGLTKSEEQTLDLIQDIFMKLWINRTTLVNIDNLNNYIFRAAQNQATNTFKRRMIENCILQKLPITENFDDSVEANFDYKILQAKLKAVVNQLPPQQKLIYTLSREHGLKHEEIANQLHISAATVKNHMVQALKTIREFLRNNLDMEGVLILILISSNCP